MAGHGEVEGTPDVMTVTMGVQTIDPSASDRARLRGGIGTLVLVWLFATELTPVEYITPTSFDPQQMTLTIYGQSHVPTPRRVTATTVSIHVPRYRRRHAQWCRSASPSRSVVALDLG